MVRTKRTQLCGVSEGWLPARTAEDATDRNQLRSAVIASSKRCSRGHTRAVVCQLPRFGHELMTARFILSFDCEGKWGVADGLTPSHRRELTEANLRKAYDSVLALLDEYALPATFAFSGAFSQSKQGFERLLPEIITLSRRAPAYLGPALRDIEATRGDGWHGDNLVAAAAGARVQHEIALHGVTHVPWTAMDLAFAQAEMRLFEALEGPVRDSRTFVYPRNLVAHQSVLAAHGFAGFRAAPRKRSRFSSLIKEFNLFEAPEQPRAKS